MSRAWSFIRNVKSGELGRCLNCLKGSGYMITRRCTRRLWLGLDADGDGDGRCTMKIGAILRFGCVELLGLP
jgi:hypothetical protein